MAAFLSICECGADISNYEHKFCTSCGRELLPDEKSIITFYFSRGFEYKSILHVHQDVRVNSQESAERIWPS